MKILITSGGTQVPIDSVRFIHNMSTGRFGAELTTEFLKRGHDVNLLHAKGAPNPFTLNVDLTKVNTNTSAVYAELSQKIMLMQSVIKNNQSSYIGSVFRTYDDYVERLEKEVYEYRPDIVVLAAAVSDYGVEPTDGKISSDGEVILRLKKLGKVIDKVREWAPDAYIVGFKLLVGATSSELRATAEYQLKRAGIDMVVGNDLSQIRKGNHLLTVFYGENDQWRINQDQALELAKMIEQRPKSVFDFNHSIV